MSQSRWQTIVMFFHYLWTVLLHKYCILEAGIRMNLILRPTSYRVSYTRLLLHDLSKLSSAEFWPYAQYFCGDKKNKDEFHQAWLHHVAYNDHHWEHFISNYSRVAEKLWGHPELAQLPLKEMPDDALLEMIADNLAATRSYEGYWPDGKKKDGWAWMTNSFNRYIIHPTTRVKLGAFLCALGYAAVLPIQFDWTSIDRLNISAKHRTKLFQLKTLAESTNF